MSETDHVAELTFQRWELKAIKPHPRNPRKHPKKGSPRWEALRKSLEHDYFDPLVVNLRNGMLVSGHLRHALLTDLGFAQVDVVVVDYDEPTHYARMIAANRQAGEFEEELLASLARELETAGFDAALAGFDEKEFASLLEGPEPVDDSDKASELVSKADELQERWKVQPGDLYQIGDHRLLCGDCASSDNWNRLLQGKRADMVWTDPPYNINYDAVQERRHQQAIEKGNSPHFKPQGILNDDVSPEEYLRLLNAWFSTAFDFTKAGGVIYVSHADVFCRETRQTLSDAGWYIAQGLIWVKNAWTLGRQDYQWQHEPVLYGWKPGAAHYWQGGYRQSTIIDQEVDLTKLSKTDLVLLVNHLRNERDTTIVREPRSTANGLHPTMKPVALVARQIWNSSRRGDTVAELFGGSGTTMAAAEQTGRRCAATELDPKYCAVILERMSTYGLTIEKLNGRQ